MLVLIIVGTIVVPSLLFVRSAINVIVDNEPITELVELMFVVIEALSSCSTNAIINNMGSQFLCICRFGLVILLFCLLLYHIVFSYYI